MIESKTVWETPFHSLSGAEIPLQLKKSVAISVYSLCESGDTGVILMWHQFKFE